MSELLGIGRFTFYEGKAAEYKRLAAEALEIVRTQDTGTLQFDVYFNDDESECIFIERFRDSDALIEHAENNAHLQEAIMATGTATGVLLGEPSAEIRERLAGSPVGVFTPFLSME